MISEWLFTKKRLQRVCFLNPQGYVEYPAPLGKTDTGGQITYIFELAKALGKKGIKVDIITRRFNNMPEETKIFPNVKIVRIEAGPNTFVPKEKIFEYGHEMANNLLAYIKRKRIKYAIINSHYWDGGFVGMLVAKKLKIPHVFTPHSLGKWKKMEMSVEEAQPQQLKPLYRYQVRIATEQRIISKADAVVLLAESLRIKILQSYLVDFEKLSVIFPGIDMERFTTKPNSLDKGIKLENNSILTVSRLVPNKGIDRLLEALYLVKKKADFHVYIVGGGNHEEKSQEEVLYSEKIQGLIKQYKLENQVTIVGHVSDDELASYYRKADVLAYPSRYEPFGIVPVEAMACGTAAIVSNVCGCKELIVDGVNGYIVDPHDREELAAKLEKLLVDPKLRKKIAENAAMTIDGHYAWCNVADAFIKLYKSLL